MRFLIPLALLSAAAAQEAPNLTIADFLSEWRVAQAETDRGEKVAKFSRLAERLAPSFSRYKALLDADKAAGRPPRACPAKGSKATVDINALVADLEKLSEAQRAAPMDAAIFAQLDRRFPCPTA
ncbi:hypothetical protein [Sphingomonas sp. OTU376]|uniref:hypothetical protein n=1 Tax=Sphingomonas sp. OTU376 TaxID=3043863 RepID=UPI00313D0750